MHLKVVLDLSGHDFTQDWHHAGDFLNFANQAREWNALLLVFLVVEPKVELHVGIFIPNIVQEVLIDDLLRPLLQRVNESLWFLFLD